MIRNLLRIKNSCQGVQGVAGYFLFAFCCVFVFFFVSNWYPAVRVGDGVEYYALFLSWSSELRPWMSNQSFSLYHDLVLSTDIQGLIPVDTLKDAFPALRVGGTYDFNHFWLYSFFAYTIHALLSLFIDLSVHQSFLLLHAFLLLIPIYFAFSLYRWKGVAVVAIMIFSSPIIWYMDKVHTEWLTFCLTLSAVIAFSGKRYFVSSLMLALASTQNVSFTLVAFFPFVVGLFANTKNGYQLKDLIVVVLIALVTLLHPAYYFFRYGVPTPQFLAGGASSSPNIFDAYLWLFDFDVGLMPNWIMGSLVFVIFIVCIVKNKTGLQYKVKENALYLLFLLIFLLINLYAHASTTNINSGATPGLSRYALWYIPLFFTSFLSVMSGITNPTGKISSRLKAVFGLFLTALLFLVNVMLYHPAVPDNPAKPTYISNWVQIHFPEYYFPNSEIYFERYSGLGERWDLASQLHAFIGPDCQKAFVFTSHLNKAIRSPAHCAYDPKKLKAIFDDPQKMRKDSKVLKINDDLASNLPSEYIYINDKMKKRLIMKFKEGNYQIGLGNKSGNFVLGDGWSQVEPWGVWSASENMKLLIPCKGDLTDNVKLAFSLGEFVPQKVIITIADKVLADANKKAKKEFDLELNLKQCEGNYWPININVSNPTAPSSIMKSGDTRPLGISLGSFKLQRK